MYVCLCHGFTDRQVRAVLDEGAAGSTAEVFRALSCKPRCGKCVSYVRDMVTATKGCGGEEPETAGGCAGLCHAVAAE